MLVITRIVFFTVGVIFFAGSLTGCQVTPPPNGPTEILLRIPDREAFLDETLTLLRQRDFTPEQVDWDDGVVVTRPATGRQWFEFWRHDSIGGYQLLESSIHTIARIVTVRVAPADPDNPSDEFRVSVQVDKQRYSAPERQVTTASGALGIYSERLPTTEGLIASRAEGEHWVPLGRDARFELYLLDKIAGATPNVTPITTVEQPAPSEKAETQETS